VYSAEYGRTGFQGGFAVVSHRREVRFTPSCGCSPGGASTFGVFHWRRERLGIHQRQEPEAMASALDFVGTSLGAGHWVQQNSRKP